MTNLNTNKLDPIAIICEIVGLNPIDLTKTEKEQISALLTIAKINELNYILENASGGGDWRRIVISRIEELESQ